MLRLSGYALLLFCLAGVKTADADTEICRSFIDNTRNQVLSIVRDSRSAFDIRHKQLVRLFESSVDIDWLGHISAGQYWSKASAAERNAYDKAYRAYLLDYYLGSLDESDLAGIADITVTEFEPVNGNIFHARIHVTLKDDDPADVDMQLVEEPQGVCRIHDFTAEGVSMVAGQSEEIQSIGSVGGMALITEKLSDHMKTH